MNNNSNLGWTIFGSILILSYFTLQYKLKSEVNQLTYKLEVQKIKECINTEHLRHKEERI